MSKNYLGMGDSKYMEYASKALCSARCKKKKLGCVLVLKTGLVIYGSNGPPLPLSECNTCPRLDDHSGTKQKKCRAVHAERQVLLRAAYYGNSTYGAVLYSYMGVPCKDCMLELIEAGIFEIVCLRETYYDDLSKDILNEWIEHGGKFRIFKEDT